MAHIGQVGQAGILADTQRAFDAVATRYHRSNEENPLLCAMRVRARATIERTVAPGSHLLDLGSGPGADAEYFARRGYRVTAIDSSPAMVREAAARCAAIENGRVSVQRLGIQEVDRLAPEQFDAVYSNFGALNCVPDFERVAHALAGRVRTGGALVASVIGRVCPWELALYLGRGRWQRATMRFRRGLVPVPLEDGTIWTRYFRPAEFARTLTAAGFGTVSLRALGFFAPPPYMQAFADRHPALVRTLQRADDVAGGWPGVRAGGDHFLIVSRRESHS